MAILYDDIYSSFYEKIDDPSFYKLEQSTAYEKMRIWIHTAAAQPYINSIFQVLQFDDDAEELTYELRKEYSANNNDDFVIDIFASHMTISWMTPKIDNSINLAVALGGKEEKMLKNDYKLNTERLNSLENALKKKIRDHGYYGSLYIS